MKPACLASRGISVNVFGCVPPVAANAFRKAALRTDIDLPSVHMLTFGDDFGSLAFRIPLGMPREGQVSGFLWFKAEEPFLVTPAIFNLLIRDDANVVAVTNNGLRNVTCSDVRGRTAVIDDIPGGVRITLRKTADNSLEHTWIITNSTSSVVHIKKISRLNNVMRDVTYTYVPEDEWATPPSWTRRDNIAQSSEQVTREDGLNDPHTGYLQETRIVRDAAGAILSHDVTGSRRFGVGQKAVLREVYHATLGLQPNGEPGLIYDSASYWTDDDHPRRNGRPRLVWGESRPWSYQAWDDEGREILRLDQYDGSDAPTQLAEFAAPSELADLAALPAISAIATVSDYAPLPGDSDAPADIDAVRTESRHLVRGGVSTLIGRTWRIYTHGTDTVGRATVTVQTIRAGSQTAALDDPGNAVSTHTRFDSDADGIPLLLRGRPVTSTDEDGVTTAYDYALGDYDPATHAFTPGGAESALCTLVSRSTAAAPDGIPGKSTQSLTIQDAAHGTTLYSATLLVGTGGSSGPALSWQANVYDDKNRLRSTLYSDGSSTTNAYSCCRLLWKIDRNGFKTLRSAETGKDHLYYAMEEESLAQLPGYGYGHRTTMHFMDALGRETNTIVTAVGDPGSASLPDCWTLDTYATETTTYPDGISDHGVHVDRRGVRTVSTSRSFADREESVALTFHPTNLAVHVLASTNITCRNGRSIAIQSWDNGWTRETFWVDYTANGTRCSFSVTEASDSPSAVTNQISQSDFLGRTVETLTPGAAGGWLVTSNAYDGATSRLTCSETTGQPATTYLYDALGESAATIQSGIATASETRYESIDGEVWQVAVRSSSSDGITNAVSTTRRQMTGLSNSLRSRSVSIDANGSTTMEESAFDPQTCDLTTTRTTDSATPFITISKFGRTIRRESLRDAVDYYFDPLGRAECSDVFHPVTDEILYSRWSAFDESDNETDYVVHYYLRVASSRGIHGAMRKRIPTRADSPLCMGAPRRSPACQPASLPRRATPCPGSAACASPSTVPARARSSAP